MCYTELEPRQRQQPSAEHGQAEAEGDGNQQSRYMKLVPLEEKSSADGYTKARRARSLEFEGTLLHALFCLVMGRIIMVNSAIGHILLWKIQ